MRLNRYLAACGLGSRRSCDALIESGRVRVNDEPGHFGRQIGPADRVTVDGAEVQRRSGGVWMLHKPAGVLCTARDPEGRPTVLALVRQHGIEARLFPVGRLDQDTTGLLLLTDDGDLGFKLTHPSFGMEKEYEAQVGRALSPAELERLQTGVDLDDGRTAPCQVALETSPSGILLRLVLHEGRKRQIRRMLRALDVPLVRLHRVRIGPLRLAALPPGSLRSLEAVERAALQAALRAADPAPSAPA